jgi:hypothetical protein
MIQSVEVEGNDLRIHGLVTDADNLPGSRGGRLMRIPPLVRQYLIRD